MKVCLLLLRAEIHPNFVRGVSGWILMWLRKTFLIFFWKLCFHAHLEWLLKGHTEKWVLIALNIFILWPGGGHCLPYKPSRLILFEGYSWQTFCTEKCTCWTLILLLFILCICIFFLGLYLFFQTTTTWRIPCSIKFSALYSLTFSQNIRWP